MILWNENWNVTWDQINQRTSHATRQPYKSIAKKHCATSQTTYQWNNLPSKHLQAKQPKVELTLHSNLPSTVMRVAMIGHRPTINRIRMYSPLLLYICSLSKTWDPDDVHCVWNHSVRISWLLEIHWPLIRYSWRSWVPCSIELSRSLAQGILRFVSSGLWAVCQGKQEKM